MDTSQLKANKWSKTSPLSDLDKIRIECGIDEDFRNKLIADPVGVLTSYGIDVPPGIKVNVVQDTLDQYNLSIPPYRGNDLSANSLSKAAGTANNTTTACTTCVATSIICSGSIASLTCA